MCVTPFDLEDHVAIIWMMNQDIGRPLGEEGSSGPQAIVKFAFVIIRLGLQVPHVVLWAQRDLRLPSHLVCPQNHREFCCSSLHSATEL